MKTEPDDEELKETGKKKREGSLSNSPQRQNVPSGKGVHGSPCL